ncbi:MAG: acyltransferase family protein [Actinomycetaceae bacterium]|nr:acyltransferase family protein [Actinomycetaceae bacterium]
MTREKGRWVSVIDEGYDPRFDTKVPPKTPRYFRPDVEGLRAIAVGAVLVSHATGWPSGGFLGVDVFFVISGFLITGLLLREAEKHGRVSLKDFYIRRVRRILPNALVVIAATTLVAWLLLVGTRAWEATKDGLWSAIFAANWRLILTGQDYFQAGQIASPMQHYWSLGVEEQFYLLWPLLIIAALWVARLAGKAGRWRRIFSVTITVLTLASLVYGAYLSQVSPTVAYFSTFTRAWELGAGSLLALASPALKRWKDCPARPTLSWLGIAGIAVSFVFVSANISFPVPWAIPVVISTLMVLASFEGGTVQAVPLLTNPVARWLGRLSFSIYLWHWPVIIFTDLLLPSSSWRIPVIFAATLALSQLSFSLYEDPIRRSSWLSPASGYPTRLRARMWPGIGLGLAASLAAATFITAPMDTPPGYTPPAVAALGPSSSSVVSDDEQGTSPECFGAQAMVNKGCDPYKVSQELTPSPDVAELDKGGAYQCFNMTNHEPPICTYGSTAPDALNVALVGDSQLAMYLPALTVIAQSNNWKLTSMTGMGYRWKEGLPIGTTWGDSLPLIQKELLDGQAFDIVITTGSRDRTDLADDADAQLMYWRPVMDRGTKVIAIASVPIVGQEAMSCMSLRSSAQEGACKATRKEALAMPDTYKQAVAKDPRASHVDFTDLLCTDTTCPMAIGNIAVYRDAASHITATYMRTMTPYIEQRLLKIISEDKAQALAS